MSGAGKEKRLLWPIPKSRAKLESNLIFSTNMLAMFAHHTLRKYLRR
jgi:hypothetical protein